MTKTTGVVLTNRERKKLEAPGEKDSYYYFLRYKAKKKALRALEDLAFLAENYPEAIPLDSSTLFIEKLLSQGKITLDMRRVRRLSRAFGRKKLGKSWLRIGGLRIPELEGERWNKSFKLSHKLLNAIYRAFLERDEMLKKHVKPRFIMLREDGYTIYPDLETLLKEIKEDYIVLAFTRQAR